MKSKKAKEFIELQESIYIDEMHFAIEDMIKSVEYAEREMIEKAKQIAHCVFTHITCEEWEKFINQLNS